MSADVEAEVTAALRAFLTAFENLDWDRFVTAFADDAIVFHPDPRHPQGAHGRIAVEASWRTVFDDIRASSSGGPPYHQLQPESLRVQLLDGTAVASFELKNAARHGRRTIVFAKRGNAWKIVHLHASNFGLQS